jgi:hypothetical protein
MSSRRMVADRKGDHNRLNFRGSFFGTDAPARTGDPQIHNRAADAENVSFLRKLGPTSAPSGQWVSTPTAIHHRLPASITEILPRDRNVFVVLAAEAGFEVAGRDAAAWIKIQIHRRPAGQRWDRRSLLFGAVAFEVYGVHQPAIAALHNVIA